MYICIFMCKSMLQTAKSPNIFYFTRCSIYNISYNMSHWGKGGEMKSMKCLFNGTLLKLRVVVSWIIRTLRNSVINFLIHNSMCFTYNILELNLQYRSKIRVLRNNTQGKTAPLLFKPKTERMALSRSPYPFSSRTITCFLSTFLPY